MKKICLAVTFILLLVVYRYAFVCDRAALTGNYEIKHGMGKEYLSINAEAETYKLVYSAPDGTKYSNSGSMKIRYSTDGWIIRFEGLIRGYDPMCENFEGWCDHLLFYYPDHQKQLKERNNRTTYGDMVVNCNGEISIHPSEAGLVYVKLEGDIPEPL